MNELRRHFDWASLLIIAVTFVLFISALFTTGFTHEILLEAAVFLVSVKLIIMAYKGVDATESLHRKLDKICQKIDQLEQENRQLSKHRD